MGTNEFTSDEERRRAIQAANVALHTHMAATYNQDEPHWRPENVANVQRRLQAVRERAGGERLVDLGCGTGFMISIAKQTGFRTIRGFDLTQAMLDEVDLGGGADVRVEVADAAAIPCDDASFDVATAYSFLHHLDDMRRVLAEAHRVLRPGGVLYADLDPNYYYWEALEQLDRDATYDAIVEREIRHTVLKDEEIEERYGIDRNTFNLAEYQKNVLGGLKEEEVRAMLSDVGFGDVRWTYNWFLGEGVLLNDDAIPREARLGSIASVDAWLRRTLPVTRHLFKYVGFTASR